MTPRAAGMTPSVLSLFMALACLFSQVLAVYPHIFSPVSNATCQSQYAWMNNAEQINPCLMVSYVIGACVGDTWTQPALPSGYSYDSPNGSTATPCYCSWSCYNLIMACTLCQDPSLTSDIKTWPAFSENCSSNYDDVVFPYGYVLDNNASIPHWATINPGTWPSELFDIERAQVYASQNNPDYWPSGFSAGSSPSKNKDLGAIIGGTIGGVVGLLLLVGGGYFLYRRRWYRHMGNNNNSAIPILSSPMASTHTRWPSDPSTMFQSTEILSMHSQGSTPMTVLSPSLHSHFQSASPPPPTETESYLTTGGSVAQRTRAIPIV